ncbi:MAG: glycosyltransferase [Candidatus Hydrogenedentes bacterium]|nr:glycosyltransferase [Candidatus Hydrogenedentota bacterium]
MPVDAQAKYADPLPPVRGLVAVANHRGRPFPLRDVQRWINLNRLMFKVDKIDVLARHVDAHLVKTLVDYARLNTAVSAAISLRTDCSGPPPDPGLLRDAGLLDVFLTPADSDGELFYRWLDACRAAGLAVRVQLCAPFGGSLDAHALAARLKGSGVSAVNVVLYDAFEKRPQDQAATLAKINELASAVAAEGIEANIYGVPLCMVADENLPLAGNRPLFFQDHQQYDRGAYELAVKLYRRPVKRAGLALAILIAGRTPIENPLDKWVVEWLLINRPWWYCFLMLAHKVTLYSRLIKGRMPGAAESAPPEPARDTAKGPRCGSCSLRRICDGETAEFKRLLPGIDVRPRHGQLVLSPAQFSGQRQRHYDAIDALRLQAEAQRQALAEESGRLMVQQTPEVLPASRYRALNTYGEPLSGAVRWHSATHAEKLSSIVAYIRPPFIISCTFGGGIADLAGFAVGKNLRLVCPILQPSHEISLYVKKDGAYVLMRDGQPVAPARFAGPYYAPVLMPDWNEIQLSLWNVDGTITTQAVRIWKEPDAAPPEPRAKYSVVIFSTRFSRRLQAALRNLAHQEGVGPGEVEVVVGYVPGIDATDDVLESVRLVHPGLRVKRAAFPEHRVKSKGFIINESVRQATGEWVVLMDADVLLPPDFFRRVEAETAGCVFMAPDGRVMLDAETTAKVLLGEIEPWLEWRALVNGGEYRHRESEGIPIGFCQIVRNTCFEKVQYEEYEHFAVADSNFGLAMRREFGQEKRLSGMPVIHLDHGGSRWFGTRGHL